MVGDPIANMLAQIKNAVNAGQKTVLIPYSNFKMEIAKILQQAGYLSGVVKKGKKVKKFIQADLVYVAGQAKLRQIKRVSKLSKRVYKKASELKPVRHGRGLGVISTSQGLKTIELARQDKLGGEYLFELW